MNLSAALVVYVLVAVISGVIRKLAENKEADQRQLDRTRDMRDRAVPFDEMDSAVEILLMLMVAPTEMATSTIRARDRP